MAAMILTDKVAIVYGAGGAVGSAVARAFAAEGATVCATGRSAGPLEALTGAVAETAVVDALDPAAVEEHLRAVVGRHGHVDVSFNLISIHHVQGVPLIDLGPEDFVMGFAERMRSHFVTASAGARHMVDRGTGVILMLTAAPDRTGIGMAGSFGVQCAAVESFARAMAVELGPRGVRVACLRSAGSPDSAGVDEVFSMHAGNAGQQRAAFDAQKAAGTLLGRMPLLADVADVAVFLASDRARAMTAAIANVTCGELLD
jgi:NAD(P)-dependent dehydrogenase (short-subunit alcohol dehydrogenase family)